MKKEEEKVEEEEEEEEEKEKGEKKDVISVREGRFFQRGLCHSWVLH